MGVLSRPVRAISHNEAVTAATRKRAGSRRGAKPKPRLQPIALVMAAGITGAVIAWGYLVYQSILHGQAIRGGASSEWQLTLGYGVGAVACLFVGFMLIARLLRRLGLTRAVDDP
jgi:hypothetical protein